MRSATGGSPPFTLSASEGTSCIAGVSALASVVRPINAPAAMATVNWRLFMPRIPCSPSSLTRDEIDERRHRQWRETHAYLTQSQGQGCARDELFPAPQRGTAQLASLPCCRALR